MALCASISLGTLAMTGPARAAHFLSGMEMMEMCLPFTLSRNPKDARHCVFWIWGAIEALHLWNPFGQEFVCRKCPQQCSRLLWLIMQESTLKHRC
jgi:hypothetical protein